MEIGIDRIVRKVYSFNIFGKLMIFLVILCSLFFIIIYFKGLTNLPMFILGIFTLFIGIAVFVISFSLRYVISDDGIIYDHPLSYFWAKVKWSEVDTITCTNLWVSHFFNVIPKKWRVDKTKKVVSLYDTGISNYKDALREIVLRAHPESTVDKYILNKIKLTEADIGRNYIPPAKLELSEKRP